MLHLELFVMTKLNSRNFLNSQEIEYDSLVICKTDKMYIFVKQCLVINLELSPLDVVLCTFPTKLDHGELKNYSFEKKLLQEH